MFGETIKFFADWQQKPLRRTALCFQNVKSKSGFDTVNIEICFLSNEGVARWGEKTTIQVGKAELCRLTILLTDTTCSTQFSAKYHGEQKEKSLTIYPNGAKGVFFRLTDNGRVLEHALDHVQRVELAVFVVKQYASRNQLSVEAMIGLLQLMKPNREAETDTSKVV